MNTKTGEWWFLHFQDLGPYGRVAHLQPVNWKDGWPVMGINDKNYCGEPVLTYKKPDVGKIYPVETPQESDEFNAPKLGLQWQWHANSQQAWGFPSSNGYFRMYAQYHPESYTNFWDIPNLLLQKLPAPEFKATAKLTVVLQNEGDKAGLVMMGWDYGYISLTKTSDTYVITQAVCEDAEQKEEEKVLASIPAGNLRTDVKYNYKTRLEMMDVYLRVEVKDGAVCQFFYSVDGEKFETVGRTFQARQGKWIGAKMGMFILNRQPDSPRSWVDVDWFRVEFSYLSPVKPMIY